MKTFKRFLKESEDPVQGQLDSMGRPCVVISHDRKKKAVTEQQKYHIHQWHDQDENAESGHFDIGEHGYYDHGSQLHKDQGTTGGHDDSGMHHTLNNYSINSTPLNSMLYRNHVTGQNPETANGASGVKHMDFATSQHSLKRPLHVFSGVQFHPDEVASQHPDRHIHLPAFTSTSIDKETAQGFAKEHDNGYGKTRHIMHFHLPKGHKGVYIGDVGHDNQISDHPHEQEFVLPRGGTWKISKHADIYEHHNGDENHVWHAHPVHPVESQ